MVAMPDDNRQRDEQPRSGESFVVMVLACADLNVDRFYYQRALDVALVNRMKEFNPDLAGALDVNQREDGSYWIMDGQHRWERAKRDGVRYILCHVHHVRREREPYFFVELDTVRKALTASQAFKPRLAHDPVAQGIAMIAERTGLTITPEGGGAFNGLRCLRTAETVFVTGGPARLEAILSTISGAWPHGRRVATETMVKALNLLFERHGAKVSQGRLVQVLRLKDATELEHEAKDMGRKLHQQPAKVLCATIERLYNVRLGAANRLGNDDD